MNKFKIHEQVTTPAGPGVVCWVGPWRYSVLIYGNQKTRKFTGRNLAYWPPRKDDA